MYSAFSAIGIVIQWNGYGVIPFIYFFLYRINRTHPQMIAKGGNRKLATRGILRAAMDFCAYSSRVSVAYEQAGLLVEGKAKRKAGSEASREDTGERGLPPLLFPLFFSLSSFPSLLFPLSSSLPARFARDLSFLFAPSLTRRSVHRLVFLFSLDFGIREDTCSPQISHQRIIPHQIPLPILYVCKF